MFGRKRSSSNELSLVDQAFSDDDREAAKRAWNLLLGQFIENPPYQGRHLDGKWNSRNLETPSYVKMLPAWSAMMIRGVALGELTFEQAQWWTTQVAGSTPVQLKAA